MKTSLFPFLDLSSVKDLSPLAAVAALCSLGLLYLVVTAIYSITLHPLSGFPGPWHTSVSSLPYWIACITGKQVQWIHKLHSQYGPVVRYGPKELSYVDQDFSAWKAVHGTERNCREFPKAEEWFVKPFNGIYGINSAPSHEDHRRFRHIFTPAFSSKAIKEWEPVFQKNIDLFLSTLRNAATSNEAVNMVEKFQFLTFDIMGCLTFGESLGLLQSDTYTQWVEAVFNSVKVIPIAQIIQYFPFLEWFFNAVEPQFVKQMKYNHFKHSADRIDNRLNRGATGTDIWSMVLPEKGDGPNQGPTLSLAEMHCHGDVFMLAGSETTGTSLAGLTYYLLANPDKLSLLVREIRSKFRSDDEINLHRISELKYLNACIKEALRLYPPVPVGVPRAVPNVASGLNMPGQPVPIGTRVSVHHYATYRSPANFRNPDSFVPQRWLGDPAYSDDNRQSYRPFAYGPRDCIGQSMALQEMQLIMARLLYGFNLEAKEADLKDWDDQKAFVLWEKKPLVVKCNPAAL